jgi:pimeloyl-ACP methyl ester carboxylesterase
VTTLVSERVGQFFVDGHRLEFTEYGAGERWVVLIHGQLMPRRMHEPLARAIAGEGFHVVTVDLLGHGRSDRPLDPKGYSMTSFGEQVVALLDHLEADQAVIGGTSLGANVSLEVADAAPERVRGLLIEMPVLDNALAAVAGIFAPIFLGLRFGRPVFEVISTVTSMIPRTNFLLDIGLDWVRQRPGPSVSVLEGLLAGESAPRSLERRGIEQPALIVGHPNDPLHPFSDGEMLIRELPNARGIDANSIFEWRLSPDRLNGELCAFLDDVWARADEQRVPKRKERMARGA